MRNEWSLPKRIWAAIVSAFGARREVKTDGTAAGTEGRRTERRRGAEVISLHRAAPRSKRSSA